MARPTKANQKFYKKRRLAIWKLYDLGFKKADIARLLHMPRSNVGVELSKGHMEYMNRHVINKDPDLPVTNDNI